MLLTLTIQRLVRKADMLTPSSLLLSLLLLLVRRRRHAQPHDLLHIHRALSNGIELSTPAMWSAAISAAASTTTRTTTTSASLTTASRHIVTHFVTICTDMPRFVTIVTYWCIPNISQYHRCWSLVPSITVLAYILPGHRTTTATLAPIALRATTKVVTKITTLMQTLQYAVAIGHKCLVSMFC